MISPGPIQYQVFEKNLDSAFGWQDCDIVRHFDSGDVQVLTDDGMTYFVHASELRTSP